MLAAGMLAGAGLGLGMMLVVRGLLAGPPPLASALAPPTDRQGPPSLDAPVAGWRHRLTGQMRLLLGRAGVDLGRMGVDLQVVGRSVEQHLLGKLTLSVAGAGLVVGVALAAWAGGVAVPPSVAVPGALGSATAGFLLPDLRLREQAARRRRGFTFALSAYLDLVHVVLAAGAGVETALLEAADAGHGWAFARLRAGLRRARLSGVAPWQAFRQLGDDLDVRELREVAASLRLAGTHGAKVRASLAAHAQALRGRDLATMEMQAESATERMSVPAVLLVVTFVVFVGFPSAYTIVGF